MRNAILHELQTEYEQQRLRNAMEEERRRRQVFSACPEIAQLMAMRENMIFAGVRGILSGDGSTSNMEQQMLVINQRIASMLKENKFEADYLDPVYRCKKCKDTGYCGEPVKDMCDCLRSAFYARLYKQVGLNERGEQSFETFDAGVFSDQPIEGQPISQRQLMDIFRQECQAWADRYPKAATSDLLLTGQSGLGKTFLMHAMAKRLLDRGFNVLLVSAYRFLDAARKAYFTGGHTDEMDSLMDTDVLMIDDLGSEPLMENITIVQLFNLINERQSRGKGTVFSTNLNNKELRERYTERIASRLLDPRQCKQLVFMGDDVRRRNG